MKVFIRLAAVAFLLSFAPLVTAETWDAANNNNGTHSWNDETNWIELTIPNGVGDVAIIPGVTPASTNPRTINLETAITIGTLTHNTTLRTNTIAAGTGGGDYNNNGLVDAADYVLWRYAMDTAGTLANDPTPGADAGDYDRWRARLGRYGINPPSLTFDEVGAGPATINVPIQVVGTTTQTGTMPITADIILTDSLVVTVDAPGSNNNGALRLMGNVSGPGGLTKMGSATFNLEGNVGTSKTYTGPTLLTSGRTRMNIIGQPALSSSFTIASGAHLEPTIDGIFTLGAGTLFVNGTGISNAGAIRPERIANVGGRIVIISNPVQLQTDSSIHSQTIVSGTNPLAITTGSITLANVVSGPGKLIFGAPGHNQELGSYYVQGNNTYAGGTELNGGTLVVGSSDPAFPTGNYTAATLGSGNVTIVSANAQFGGAQGHMTIAETVADAIDDDATLSLFGGAAAGVADDGYLQFGLDFTQDSLISETVAGLILGGVAQSVSGTYGSSASGATFNTAAMDEFFKGIGVINLVLPPGSGFGSSAGVPEPATISLVGLFISFMLLGQRRRFATQR